jgi:uncharacterized protein YbjT (DUF2867 family)
MKILVTTPNGKVGSELVKRLEAARIPFRLGARSPDKVRATHPGAEIARLDYDDPASLAAAVDGVDTLYLAAPGDFAAARVTPLVDAAKAARVRRIVKLSAMGAEMSDNPLSQADRYVESSGLEYTLVRPTWFDQNFSTTHAAAIRQGAWAEPAGTGKTAFIDTRDIADVAFAALTRDGHAGKAYALPGPEVMDRHRVASILSGVLDRPVAYLPVDDAQFRASVQGFIPPSYVELLSALYAGVRAGWTEVRTETVAQVLGRAPIAFEQFARDHRNAWA